LLFLHELLKRLKLIFKQLKINYLEIDIAIRKLDGKETASRLKEGNIII